jgi:hypothetical protein
MGRALVLGACAALAAWTLAGCSGRGGSAQQIRDVVVLSATLPNGDDCDNAYTDVGLRQRYGGPGGQARRACRLEAQSANKPTAADVTVTRLKIQDQTATAVISVRGRVPRAKISLLEEGGHWKIDAFRRLAP